MQDDGVGPSRVTGRLAVLKAMCQPILGVVMVALFRWHRENTHHIPCRIIYLSPVFRSRFLDLRAYRCVRVQDQERLPSLISPCTIPLRCRPFSFEGSRKT